MNKNVIKYLLLLVVAFVLSCGKVGEVGNNVNSSSSQNILDAILETGKYTAKDSVAAYIYLFHKLPSNYVNKATGQTFSPQLLNQINIATAMHIRNSISHFFVSSGFIKNIKSFAVRNIFPLTKKLNYP